MNTNSLVLPLAGEWDYNDRLLRLVCEGRTIQRTYFSSRPSGIHAATDIGMTTGTRYRSMDDMTIRRIGNEGNYGYGRYIIGSHYWEGSQHDIVAAHLQDTTVGVGRKVTPSTTIAHTDDSGNSSGPHLHLEWWWHVGDRASRVDIYWLLVWLTERKQGIIWHRNPYPAPSVSSVTDRPIQYGEHSYRTMWVQWALERSAIHGHYGTAIRSRVMRFQRANGIEPTGKVGSRTRAALMGWERRET